MVGLLLFIVPATASAYNTYVGLKIESVNNPNMANPTTWCLPSDLTTMTINDGTEDIDSVITSTETCPLGTIWSNLVNLTSEWTYTINLSSYSASGDFKAWGGYLWWRGTTNQSCTEVCADYNGCAGTCDEHDSPAGEVCHMWYPDVTAGGGCAEGSVGYRSSVYCCTCWHPADTCNTNSCDYKQSIFRRFCVCKGSPIDYTFTFQAPVA